MRERGVICKAHEVRAILAGTKTQFRAVVKPQPDASAKAAECLIGLWWFRNRPNRNGKSNGGMLVGKPVEAPYEPGDRLWVRETWRPDDGLTMLEQRQGEIFYRASHCFPKEPTDCFWRSPVTMPRWASRLTLEVESVRVERLQEISAEDIIAEGVRASVGAGMINGDTCYHMTTNSGYMRGDSGARHAFWDFWNSIHGAGAWEANPFVWVVEFKRILP